MPQITQRFREWAPRMVADLMRDFGFSDFQAAGIVGNGGHESGGFEQMQELRPTVAGSRGGLGVFQWTGPRRREFEAWLKRKGWNAHQYEANYSFLFRELIGPEKKTVPAVKAAKTLAEATETFCRVFERPGIVHAAGRLWWAQQALALYRAAPLPQPEQPMTPTPPLNPPVPKPWYTSKTIIGAIIAIVTPILAKAIPFFGLIPDAVVEQTVEQFLLVVGPMIGGLLAGFGRLAVTAPIASTQAAVVVEKRYEAALNEPSLSQVVQAESWREEPVAATPTRPDYDLDAVPFSVLVEWLPRIRHMLQTLDGALQQPAQLPAPERRD